MRPTEHGFVGPLAGELEEYIRFKASMGRHGATRVQVLRLVRPALPRTRGRASGAGRRGAMDRP